MITFADIVKGKFLEEFSALSMSDALIAIALSFALSLFIVFIYRVTYAGVNYSRNFTGCLMMLSMVTTMVILVISSNMVLSLGMVGALSIVRFRTAVKEPADTAFLFWAIATGIICGAGYVTISILMTLLLGLLFVAVHAFAGKQMIPVAMAQKRKAVSVGSFTAVRKRTMDRAPTMPRDSTMLELMTRMTMVVTMDSIIRQPVKLRL